MKFLDEARQLYEQFNASSDDLDRFDFPFPMAVFGTLRSFPKCQGNSHRMYFGGVKPIAHLKGFLPHVIPQSLWLNFQEGYAGPFEIYFYSPEDWQKIIPGVDALESFRKQRKDYGYLRTLMGLKILPEGDYAPFKEGISFRKDSFLDIPEKDFDKYETVPAWVYSNRECNDLNLTLGEKTSVFWDAFAR